MAATLTSLATSLALQAAPAAHAHAAHAHAHSGFMHFMRHMGLIGLLPTS
jgi:hypothetical protein